MDNFSFGTKKYPGLLKKVQENVIFPALFFKSKMFSIFFYPSRFTKTRNIFSFSSRTSLGFGKKNKVLFWNKSSYFLLKYSREFFFLGYHKLKITILYIIVKRCDMAKKIWSEWMDSICRLYTEEYSHKSDLREVWVTSYDENWLYVLIMREYFWTCFVFFSIFPISAGVYSEEWANEIIILSLHFYDINSDCVTITRVNNEKKFCFIVHINFLPIARVTPHILLFTYFSLKKTQLSPKNITLIFFSVRWYVSVSTN